jgi:hypothetical protein
MRSSRPPAGGTTTRAESATYHRAEAPLAATPAELLLHPVAVAAVALLVVNDHLLKSAWPGFLTGKLSDAAGLIVVPLVLLGCWEVARWLIGRWTGPSRRALPVAVAITAVAFFLVKATDAGASAFGWLLSFGQWLPAWLIGLVSGHESQMGEPAPITNDATDLIAMPLLLVATWIGSRRNHGSVSSSPASGHEPRRGRVRLKAHSEDSKDLPDHPGDRRLRSPTPSVDSDERDSELQGFRSVGRPDQVRHDSKGQ